MKRRVGFQFNALGGTNEVQLYVASEDRLQALSKAVVAEVLRIQGKFSRYQESSVVTRINGSAGKSEVEIDEETHYLLSVADSLYKKSGGLFDITSGVLRRAWDFKSQRVPTAEQLEELRPLIGWDQIVLSNSSICLPAAQMEIDLGGVGKEFAVDRVADILQKNGICHTMINFGGDIHILGPHPDGRPWRVGISHPRKAGEVIKFVEMFRGSLATSGDYERYFELDGTRYCHILNPRTLLPMKDFQSVSVMAESCLFAGGLATSAMLLGRDVGVKFLEAENLPFLIIGGDGSVLSVSGRNHKSHGTVAST